ncbi:MAG: Na+/H+ antiporter subunit E [Comamonadaceae bacterium]|nr:MAG: Na+/H+ antiporter subunit E [Comamonadaceae bacterium]
MARFFPSLTLSATLFIVWILLQQSVHPATLLSALLVALVVPLITRSLRPASVVMRRPDVLARLAVVVIRDMVRSAWLVGREVLTKRNADIHSAFLRVPLDTRDPNALAGLAMIVCLTPGTAWAELSMDRSVLLLHVFELKDEQGMIDMIKTRYERPLMQIFEGAP